MSHFLPINTETFNFYEREKNSHGTYITNKCWRDYFYYALHYLYPEKFNNKICPPIELETKLGFRFSPVLAWTMLQFVRHQNFLKDNNVILSVSGKKLNSWVGFLWNVISTLYISSSRKNELIKYAMLSVVENKAVGLDIGMNYFNTLDHVMFVQGFDNEYFYVFDTRTIPGIKYEKIDNNKPIYRIDIKEVEKKILRVWVVSK
jgi:hypothetical protein